MWLPVPARARIGCVSFDLSFLREGQALGTHSTSFNYLAETLQDSSDYRQEKRSGPFSVLPRENDNPFSSQSREAPPQPRQHL